MFPPSPEPLAKTPTFAFPFFDEPTTSDGASSHSSNSPLMGRLEASSPLISPRRRVSIWHVGFMIFFLVSGGPSGIEDTVAGAGPLLTLISFLVVPFVWGMPQALMTAELSTMCDDNGGYIIWVRRAFGDFAGFVNSWNAILCNVVDLALYPVLFLDFLEELYPMTQTQRLIALAAIVSFVLVLNLRSLDVVGNVSIALTLFVLLPFMVTFFWALPSLDPSAFLRMPKDNNINWTLFLNTVLWSYSGFDSLGSIAGEVENPKRTYVRGVVVGLLLISLGYFVPILAAVSLYPDYSKWEDGSLVTAANTLSPWMGRWTMVAVMMGNLGSFNTCTATTSRALWRVADYGMVPRCLSSSWRRYNVPVVAVCIQCLGAGFLALFSFEFLLQFDNFLNCITLVLEFAAFLWLRHSEPHARRPYVVPGGWVGAWVITIPKLLFIGVTMFVADIITWVVCGAVNVLVLVLYVLWARGHLAFLGWHPIKKAVTSPSEGFHTVNTV